MITTFLQNPLIVAIDIGIMTYLVYLLINFAKQSHALAVLEGVFLIIVAKIIADAINLYALSWVIDQVITWGVIAIIIIFQPEIRRSLEQLGTSAFKWRMNSKEDQVDSQAVVEELVQASKYLSKRYIGALMCIENKNSLKFISDTGVALNANLTSQLLINMFTPNTPLHDGAVIIKNNRVVAASCVLPLTENQDVPQELGTRHRAGLGLSEHSDALTIIVSEETGDISATYQRHLYRKLTEEELRDLLTSIAYLPKNQAGKKNGLVERIRQFFLDGGN